MTDNQRHIISEIKDLVKEKFEHEGTGHDWWHIFRVWQLSAKIADTEKADKFIVELAALLHDIADHKLWKDPEEGIRLANQWLMERNVEHREEILFIIKNISFKGAKVIEEELTLEGQIVQDADRIDALGAIGIARAFSYGGSKGRLIFDPDLPSESHDSFEAYKNSQGPTINHFYEKLLLLKHRMNTETGKQLAMERHQFMLSFLDQFYKEWNSC